tara:strand:- start:1092 stop:1286 length:195 start_codon:yes stop_codon:yes gene_type:complete
MTDRLPLTNGDTTESMAVVWEALHTFKEIAEMLRDHLGIDEYDEYWSDINTAMAWIQEGLDEQI